MHIMFIKYWSQRLEYNSTIFIHSAKRSAEPKLDSKFGGGGIDPPYLMLAKAS